MPRSYACLIRRVNPSCPSSRCTRPLKVPVPSARRVTFTPDFPRVTQSVADLRPARAGIAPVPANKVAAKLDFKKSRRVAWDMNASANNLSQLPSGARGLTLLGLSLAEDLAKRSVYASAPVFAERRRRPEPKRTLTVSPGL